MKLTYDPKYNIAYISLKAKPTQVETVHLSDSVNIDMAPDGTVYGIELLDANEQLGPEAAKKGFVSINITAKEKYKGNLRRRPARS